VSLLHPCIRLLIVENMLQVDVDAVDFGLVAFGFRYAKEFTLTNTCAIPMQYAWRVPKDSLDPAHKEFTVSVARFTSEMTCNGHKSLYLIFEAAAVQSSVALLGSGSV
jgi:hypothetical protein